MREAEMRRSMVCAVVGFVLVIGSGCGAPPDQQTRTRETSQRGSDPTPTRPATGAWGQSFDAEANFPDYELTLVRSSWVQLDHREADNTTMVVGFEPLPGTTLDEALADHLQQFGDGAESPVSGTHESEILGTIVWSQSSFELDDGAITQLALFAEHPTSGPMLIARFEFPSTDDSTETELSELIRATEIIGPGL
jgi:hypothetical protein